MDRKKKSDYTSRSIEILKGLEGVRRRPAMYIGDVSKRGLHHLVFELVDNCIDEALAGYAKKVEVIIRKTGEVTVKDDGRGIPVDPHPELNIPGVEVVMTVLHAGSKFDSKIYPISGGLHGVGASVVCALSEKMEVLVKRDGKVYRQTFSKGNKTSDLEVIGDTEETGTEITFLPDKSIFQVTEFDYHYIKERLLELSFLIPGIEIYLEDERTLTREKFYHEGGVLEFLTYLNTGRESISDPFYFKTTRDSIEVEIALQYTNTFFETLLSYVNTIPTKEGGTHVTGLKTGLTRAINDYGKKYNLLKKPVLGEDTREGLTCIIHVKMRDPQFEGQTKTKLGNSIVKGLVDSIVYERFYYFLEDNPKDAQAIIQKVLLAAQSREASKRARDLTRKKSFIESDTLPGKLADCSTKDSKKSELFIVEGESAGGSAKQGRNREFQAILAIKGKILNVEKAGMDKALTNEEIRAIVQAIGCGIKEKCNPKESRYGKIIIMTDADVDGAHIRTLLLTLFFRYLRPLIEEGYLYIATPPLYRVSKDKKVWYLYSDTELQKLLKELGGTDGVTIQRYKGLGEMNPEQLWETTMSPEKRVLKKVTIEDAIEADRLLSILMGEKVEPRREFIIENANLVTNLDI